MKRVPAAVELLLNDAFHPGFLFDTDRRHERYKQPAGDARYA
jgi:hypothetical protein